MPGILFKTFMKLLMILLIFHEQYWHFGIKSKAIQVYFCKTW
jgi:hypothetical protein